MPRHVIRSLDGTARDAAALVEAGLWREVKAGWIFHEWSVYQPDAASLKARRASEAEGGALGNHIRWHTKRGVTVPGCEYCDGMPPDDDIEPFDPYQVPDQGGDGGGESPPNRPVPEPVPDPLVKVSGGGNQSNAQASEPPPPPTPEILDSLAEPWRCPIHQGIDTACLHCKRYKAAHKSLEAERTKAAKEQARADRRAREQADIEDVPPAAPEVIAAAKARVSRQLRGGE